MGMTIVWIGQLLLAAVFGLLGVVHITQFDRMAASARTAWVTAVGRRNMAVIGVLEILGATGLLLPAITGVAPWLMPLAGACLGALMLAAVVFHRRRGEPIVGNVALAVIAAAVAIGRVAVS